jgi:antitoxin component of MazEF toxin-antitoxin module
MTRKIIKIGDSVGVTIPKSIIEKLDLEVGEEVAVDVDEKTNEVRIRAGEEGKSRDDKIAQRTMSFIDRYRSDLEALADK